MKFIEDVWDLLVEFFEEMSADTADIPTGFQPNIVSDEIDSPEGWK